MWKVIWFVQVKKIIQWSNYYSILGFWCSLIKTYSSEDHLILNIHFFYNRTKTTCWQRFAVIMAFRTQSQFCSEFHNMDDISVCHSDDCSSPVEDSLPGSCLWYAGSYESPFVLTFTRNMMQRHTVCMCEASIVQQGRHALLFRPPAGWPRGQHHWDKAGLFCSHDVMANKAPWWNWLPLCKPTITLDIDDVTHPRQPRLLQGQQGHERGGGGGGGLCFTFHLHQPPPLSLSRSRGLPNLPFVSHRWQPSVAAEGMLSMTGGRHTSVSEVMLT